MKQQKWAPGKPSNIKKRAFWRPTLRWMVAILSPEHPFYLHVWAFHLPVLPFGSVISPFQECQHSNAFSCSRETWEVLTPEQEENLRFQECFRDTTVRKEHQKAPWKHHKWHSQGLLNTFQSLEMHQWCWKSAPNAAQMLLTMSEWPPESWESAGHICTIMTALFSAFWCALKAFGHQWCNSGA